MPTTTEFESYRTIEQIVSGLRSTPFELDTYGNVVSPPSPETVRIVENEMVGYQSRAGYLYETADGERSKYPTAYLSGTRQLRTSYTYEDADLAGYREEDRGYDRWAELEPDVTNCGWGNDARSEPSLVTGWNLRYRYAGGSVENVQAHCWYCDQRFTYSEFASYLPQALTPEDAKRAFAYEMLAHNAACRDEHLGVPVIWRWVTEPTPKVALDKGYARPSVLKRIYLKPALPRAEFVGTSSPDLMAD